MVLSMESISCGIFGDGCVGPNCMDMTVARPMPERIERNPRFLSMELGKAKYLSLAI
jgi:hypothetical protein